MAWNISRQVPRRSNVYFPRDAPIKIHQNRVTHCPKEFPARYFWYGGKRKGTGNQNGWNPNRRNWYPYGLVSIRAAGGLSSEEGELEPPGKDLASDTKANEAIDEVQQAKPVENNELVEPKSVEKSEEESLVTSSSRNRGAHYALRQSIKPPPRRYS